MICPAGGVCKTDLQRSVHGTLVDGVKAHLLMVHGWPETRARRLAEQAVEDMPEPMDDGCVAEHAPGSNPACEAAPRG